MTTRFRFRRSVTQAGNRRQMASLDGTQQLPAGQFSGEGWRRTLRRTSDGALARCRPEPSSWALVLVHRSAAARNTAARCGNTVQISTNRDLHLLLCPAALTGQNALGVTKDELFASSTARARSRRVARCRASRSAQKCAGFQRTVDRGLATTATVSAAGRPKIGLDVAPRLPQKLLRGRNTCRGL